MVSISGISSLGVVINERINLSNNLLKLPRPTLLSGSSTNSSNTTVVNLLGKLRVVTLSGYFVGTDAEILVFVNAMNTWTNSGRQTSKTYTPSFGDAFSVLCDVWEWERSNEFHNRIDYSIELIEGGTLSFITGV